MPLRAIRPLSAKLSISTGCQVLNWPPRLPKGVRRAPMMTASRALLVLLPLCIAPPARQKESMLLAQRDDREVRALRVAQNGHPTLRNVHRRRRDVAAE